MRSVHMAGNKEVEIVDVPEPVAGPGEVIVQTAVSALCGSELHGYRGDGPSQGNSGHEGVGTVVALGEGVTHPRLGQRVGVSVIAGCNRCDACAKGQYTWCHAFRFYGSMHAERFLAAAHACHPLPDDVGWEAGVLLTGDGMGVPYHTSTKLADPEFRTIAVFGAGPIGLGNVLMQTHLGRRVIAVDVVPERLDMARRLGAAETVNAGQGDPVESIRRITGGGGADACIEAAGRPETARACFAAVRTAGTVVFNGEQSALSLSPSDHFIRRDITAVGAWFYHFSEFAAMLACFRQGLRVTDLITHRYPFAEANAAFAQFASGQSGKVILQWNLTPSP